MPDDRDPSPWAPDPDEERPAVPRPDTPPLNDDPWAPQGDRSHVVPSPTPIAADPDFAPPSAAPSPVVAPRPAPLPEENRVDEPPDVLSVGPVAARVSARSSRWSRAAAVAVAILLVGGGGYLAFTAGSATGGADSPEAALEQMLDALASEDLIAAAEIIEPSERETLIEAGFEFIDELVRLEVLADDLNLAAVDGLDIGFTGFEVRAEFPRSGLAHLFLSRGVFSRSVVGPDLPLGPLVADRHADDWLAFFDSRVQTIEPTVSPIVAVRREDRWYLSLWYTVAENARIQADQPLPDLGRRPARIGADSPEAAVRALADEALRLDVRRLIGMLDPVEAAVIYDYSPLFLDGATASANSALESLEEDDWTWELESFELTTVDNDGEVARVEVDGFDLAARSDTGSLDVNVDADSLQIVFKSLDIWGEPVSYEVTSDGGCSTFTWTEGAGSESQQSCAGETRSDEFGGVALFPFTGFPALSVATHEVDDRWFISPTRTGAATYLKLLRSLSPDELAAMIDGFVSLAQDSDTVGITRTPTGTTVPTLDDAVVGGDSQPTFRIPVNADLLASELGIVFAYDLDNQNASDEIGWWVPAIADLPIDRGVAATVEMPSGSTALTILVASSVEEASAAGETLSTQEGAVIVVDTEDLRIIQLPRDLSEPLTVAVDGDRVIIVAPSGALSDDVDHIIDLHTS